MIDIVLPPIVFSPRMPAVGDVYVWSFESVSQYRRDLFNSLTIVGVDFERESFKVLTDNPTQKWIECSHLLDLILSGSLTLIAEVT